MRTSDLIRLISLAAIWGFSFLFLRIVAPVLGPLWTVEVRVGLAGVAMLAFLAFTGRSIEWRKNWKVYLIVSAVNSALPFALFSYAALTLPTGYSAIINATTPMWAALIGAVLYRDKLSARSVLGLVIGVVGVACLVRLGPVEFTAQVALAVAACAAAAFSYAVAGVYSKKSASTIPSALLATGSQLGSALLILPFLPLSPVRAEVTPFVMLIAATLAIFCSAIAYFIYFRLLADVGPSKAMTVTFLVPLFALTWGTVFLDEAISAMTLLGCAMVVLATWLVVTKKPTNAKS